MRQGNVVAAVLVMMGGLLAPGAAGSQTHGPVEIPPRPELTFGPPELVVGPYGARPVGHGGPKNLVEVASAAGGFETLLAAAEAAGLVETLSSGGPFTVFAPTDEAFGRLPEGALASLLEDREALRGVLTYHVVSGRVTAKQAAGLSEAGTVNGAKLRLRTVGEKLMVDDATVLRADLEASNGMIHVIDRVLLPPSS